MFSLLGFLQNSEGWWLHLLPYASLIRVGLGVPVAATIPAESR